jgi:hypothetical protein
MIASDVALVARPQVRAFVRQMMTETMVNFDGSPVLGPDGKTPLTNTWWEALFRTGMSKCIEGDVEWAKLIWYTCFGKPREDMQLSGPGGGPIATTTKLDVISSDEMAERMRRALEIVGIAPSGARQEDPVEMIEVSAHEFPAQDATTEPVSIPATAAMGMATKPATPPQQAQSVLPMTGMIPARR